ncbi:MAG: hypothetical protein ACJAS4_001899 [Bacteriovoracaceae bacterium]|jgi:hypothetical protein
MWICTTIYINKLHSDGIPIPHQNTMKLVVYGNFRAMIGN